MKNFYSKITFFFLLLSLTMQAQQLPNNQFEDWSGTQFDGNIQPASWNYSNVTQFSFKFNFAQRETGRTGYCMKVEDQELGAAGITEVSPGYISLGTPWVYIPSITKVGQATAGTHGGIAWTYRPDTMEIWIKRTGNNALDEDFHLLYYAWTGKSRGDKYKGKNGDCTEVSWDNEESDIRQSTDRNECGTTTKATQVAEGWLRARAVYNDWTKIKVPIFYIDNTNPTMMNIIFSASNYPNFRANSGLFKGNALYVDDIRLIYSSRIDQLIIDGDEWKNFDPNSTEVQYYPLGDDVETMPSIKAMRGIGQLTNSKGETTYFRGRKLEGNEITITPGEIDKTPTLITVRAEDGSSETTYKILFSHKLSNNAYLANIKVNNQNIGFSQYNFDYTAEIEYGDTAAPVVTVVKLEEEQQVSFTQPTSLSDVTKIVVTAADRQTTKTYTVRYKEGLLSDNTLQNILVNDNPLPSFSPNKTNYTRVSIPLGTTEMPKVEAISKYPAGMQTIQMTPPSVIDGGTYKIAVTTPGNPTPKEYKLTFVLELSPNCQLKGIQIGGQPLENFSPDVTSYFISLPLGTSSLPEITYTPGDAYQTITLTEGGIDGTSRITVTAANGDQMVYKLTFSTTKSEISTLNGITLDGEMLPGFASDITNYNVALPIGTTELPQIDVIKGDPYQIVTIRTGGLNGTTRITVQAGNGNTTIYQITFSVAQATNATLKAITVGGELIPGFDPSVLEYSYVLPKGTTELPVVGYTPNDEFQTITTRSGGVNGDYKITVRPQSGASQTYIIHFSVPKSDNIQLQMIYLDGQPLKDFDPEVLDYTDTLENTNYPQVTYTANEGQKIISYLDQNVHTIKVTAESGRSQTYTVTFIVRVSESAFLKMIYLDGDSLEGFHPEQLIYKNIIIPSGASPRITVDSEEGQQVTILSPASEGTAQIIVSTTIGNPNTYSLELVDTTVVPVPHLDPKQEYIPSHDAALSAILADGVVIEGFDSTKTDYTLHLAADATIPTITFVPNTDKQTVVAGQIAQGIHQALVTAEDGNSRTYVVTISRELYHNAYLVNLQVEGQQLDFKPQTLNYTLTLDKGQSLPQVYYQAAPGQTVMFYASSNESQQLIVTAEDGTSNTYILTYTRVYSSNALLKDIIISDTKDSSIANFDPHTYHYTYTLPFRAAYVPAVNAIGAVSDQIITTYHSAVKGTTRIHVVAEDGVTTADYTIDFPAVLSSKTELNSIILEGEYTSEFVFDPEIKDYVVTVPFSATIAPSILFERGEKEQSVTLVANPIGKTSKVIVRAENGNERTYSITFQRDAAPAANILKKINIEGVGTLDMSDPNQHEWTIALPYGTSTMSVTYEKNFDGQTVLVEAGGIFHPTILTVLSNNASQANTIYTLTPEVNTQNPATLTDIKVDGVTIDGFNRNRFSYIVNRTSANATPVVTYSAGSDVDCQLATSLWTSFLTVTCQGYTNTYKLYFHYTNDVIPNGEFTNWTTAKYNNGPKPTSWQVVADAVDSKGAYSSGGEVKQDPTGVAYLYTRYPGLAGVGGMIPGFITLGTVTGNLGVAGSSSFQVSGGIGFHNTPDIMSVRYKAPAISTNNRIIYQLTGNNGYKELIHSDKDKISDYTTLDIKLDEANAAAGNPTLMNIIFNSYYTESGTIAANNAEMYVDWVRFSFNNLLTSILANNNATTRNGNDFSYTLKTSEEILLPNLTFTGEVKDQAQKVEWSAEKTEGEYKVRRANITNYGEDGNSSSYTLAIKRPMNTSANLNSIQINGVKIANFSSTTYAYTYALQYGTAFFPDIAPVVSSCHQFCQTTLADSIATIVVTAENGTQQTYTIRFKMNEAKATLKNITASNMTPVYDPDVKDYTIKANEWPSVLIEKFYDAQGVTMHDGVIDVVAANGAKEQYRLHLKPDSVPTSGQLSELEVDGDPLFGFQPDIYRYETERPERMKFIRKDASDSVVYIQTADSLVWQVYGTENHTYVLTQTGGKSTSTDLKGIYVDGVLIDGFDAQLHDYTLMTDTAVEINAIGVNDKQTITIEFTNSTYTITVTSEDGQQGTPYTLTLLPVTSADASLKAIYLDNELLEEFSATIHEYEVVIPTGSYKQAEPVLPYIDYITTDPKASVELEMGNLSEPTKLYVTSSDNTIRATYSIQFIAEPSHNAQLSAIAVNDIPLENFEPGRHFYSTWVVPGAITFDWRSLDNFQQVSVDTISPTQYILHVLAQDGITIEDYTIDVFTIAQSSDATLKNILIDGEPMDQFLPELNPDLMFNSGLNKYTINIPAHLLALPQVAATLKEEGQSVVMRQSEAIVYLDVTAEDGSQNTYILKFVGNLSKNTDLKAIYLNGVPYAEFQADRHFYFIDMPAGEHNVPDLIPLKAESVQQWDSTSVSLSIGQQVTITVTAENQAYQSQYVIVFQLHPSDVDTLALITADSLHYSASIYNYYITIPYRADHQFPNLDWEKGDEYQTVQLDTLEHSEYSLTRQLVVVAESGRTNRYTITYTMIVSSNTMLKMIYLNGTDSLPGFNPATTDYICTLPIGTTTVPQLDADFDAGTQSVVQYDIEPSIPNALAASQFVVTAQNGDTRTYTVTLMVAPDTTATLTMIYYNGQKIPRYDESIMIYTIAFTQKEATMPVISYDKHDELQRVDLHVIDSNMVQLVVTADDGITTATYSISFEPYLSNNNQLTAILLNDTLLEGFDPNRDSYEIKLLTLEAMPEISYVLSEPEQRVMITTAYRYNAESQPYDVIKTLNVIPENGVDTGYYELTFHIKANTPLKPEESENALLSAIYVRGQLLSKLIGFDKDFMPDSTDYRLMYPVGTSTESFFNLNDIFVTTQDALAKFTQTTDTVFAPDSVNNDVAIITCIHIIVQAPAGNNKTYHVYQQLELDMANHTTNLLVDGKPIANFDPNVTYYEYTLPETASNAPKLTLHYGNTTSRFACVRYDYSNDSRIVDCTDMTNYAFDNSESEPTYHIYYRSEDGTKYMYKVKFRRSEIKSAQKPMEGDVLIQHIPGSTQIAVASLRSNVVFGLYDMSGRMVELVKLPEGDPNSFATTTDGYGQTYFGHVTDYSSCTILTLEPNKLYFWVFTENGKRKIKSGKLTIQQ